MNTGHDGSLTTLHANSPEDAVLRLMTMVRYAAELPVDVIERQICSALHMGVQVARDAAGNRYVSQVVEFHFDDGRSRAGVRELYRRDYAGDAGRWLRAPAWLDALSRQGIADDGEVERWMSRVS